MNNIWFFGDSFTHGRGCRPGDEYYEKYLPKENDKLWVDIVTEKLNLNQKRNPRYGMGANPYLLSLFINDIPSMLDNDIVVISDSNPDGVLSYDKKKDKVGSVNSGTFWDQKWNKYFDTSDVKNKSFNYHHKQTTWHDYLEWSDDPKKMILVDYSKEHFAPYKDKWSEWYFTQIKSLSIELIKRNIKVYFWSYKEWFKDDSPYQLIVQQDNDIKDGHFSWLGHRQFSEFILNKLNSKSLGEQ
tara:strand:+ start:140 stop:865 length:726 start_codon:yes stop_codon:yes gene_type:complete